MTGAVTGEALVAWGPERVDDLAELVGRAMPDERLVPDELLGVLYDDPGVVLGFDDGAGVVAAVTRPLGSATVGHVRLVAVDPSERRRGRGLVLLRAAEAWLAERGASHVVLGGEVPTYLWPGVPAQRTEALCLAEAAGYACAGMAVNAVLATSFRAPAPDEVVIARLVDDDLIASTRTMVAEHWPNWLVEFDRGVEGATVHGAFTAADAADPVRPLGFCAHSVWRTGWLGPMGTDPSCRGNGVGAALVGAVAEDLMVAGRHELEVAWVGPVRFYAKLGARVGTVFASMSRGLL